MDPSGAIFGPGMLVQDQQLMQQFGQQLVQAAPMQAMAFMPPGAQAKRCACKKARCLKLYCVCFAAGMYCDGCGCEKCQNTERDQGVVMAQRARVLTRNPQSFLPKVDPMAPGAVAQHKKGCRCKKSKCLKKYCECVNCHNRHNPGAASGGALPTDAGGLLPGLEGIDMAALAAAAGLTPAPDAAAAPGGLGPMAQAFALAAQASGPMPCFTPSAHGAPQQAAPQPLLAAPPQPAEAPPPLLAAGPLRLPPERPLSLARGAVTVIRQPPAAAAAAGSGSGASNGAPPALALVLGAAGAASRLRPLPGELQAGPATEALAGAGAGGDGAEGPPGAAEAPGGTPGADAGAPAPATAPRPVGRLLSGSLRLVGAEPAERPPQQQQQEQPALLPLLPSPPSLLLSGQQQPQHQQHEEEDEEDEDEDWGRDPDSLMDVDADEPSVPDAAAAGGAPGLLRAPPGCPPLAALCEQLLSRPECAAQLAGALALTGECQGMARDAAMLLRHILCLACANPAAYAAAAEQLLIEPAPAPTAAPPAAAPRPAAGPGGGALRQLQPGAGPGGCARRAGAAGAAPRRGPGGAGGGGAERSWSDSGESLSLNCCEEGGRRPSARPRRGSAGAALQQEQQEPAGAGGDAPLGTPPGWGSGASPGARKASGGSGSRKHSSGASGAALMVATAAANRAGATGARRVLPGLARGGVDALAAGGAPAGGGGGGGGAAALEGWQSWQRAQEGQAAAPPAGLLLGSPPASQGQPQAQGQGEPGQQRQQEQADGAAGGSTAAKGAAAPSGITKLMRGSFLFAGNPNAAAPSDTFSEDAHSAAAARGVGSSPSLQAATSGSPRAPGEPAGSQEACGAGGPAPQAASDAERLHRLAHASPAGRQADGRTGAADGLPPRQTEQARAGGAAAPPPPPEQPRHHVAAPAPAAALPPPPGGGGGGCAAPWASPDFADLQQASWLSPPLPGLQQLLASFEGAGGGGLLGGDHPLLAMAGLGSPGVGSAGSAAPGARGGGGGGPGPLGGCGSPEMGGFGPGGLRGFPLASPLQLQALMMTPRAPPSAGRHGGARRWASPAAAAADAAHTPGAPGSAAKAGAGSALKAPLGSGGNGGGNDSPAQAPAPAERVDSGPASAAAAAAAAAPVGDAGAPPPEPQLSSGGTGEGAPSQAVQVPAAPAAAAAAAAATPLSAAHLAAAGGAGALGSSPLAAPSGAGGGGPDGGAAAARAAACGPCSVGDGSSSWTGSSSGDDYGEVTGRRAGARRKPPQPAGDEGPGAGAPRFARAPAAAPQLPGGAAEQQQQQQQQRRHARRQRKRLRDQQAHDAGPGGGAPSGGELGSPPWAGKRHRLLDGWGQGEGAAACDSPASFSKGSRGGAISSGTAAEAAAAAAAAGGTSSADGMPMRDSRRRPLAPPAAPAQAPVDGAPKAAGTERSPSRETYGAAELLLSLWRQA
ncbi:MAG: hypothetical protein J3K34DRAFT_520302 [Monoraphidium minutum]|nr:MAG: hypothetical protein J3K34DRAFT_520302 [Monoraphidium minutum]